MNKKLVKILDYTLFGFLVLIALALALYFLNENTFQKVYDPTIGKTLSVISGKEEKRAQECRSYGVTAKANIKMEEIRALTTVTAHYVYFPKEDKCIYETYYVIQSDFLRLESCEMTDLFTGNLILNFAYSIEKNQLIAGNARSCQQYRELRQRYFGEGLKYCK